MTKPYNGARYEIAIDGTPRTYRDRKELAIETATLLKTKNVHSEASSGRNRPKQTLWSLRPRPPETRRANLT